MRFAQRRHFGEEAIPVIPAYRQNWCKEQKLNWLTECSDAAGVQWRSLIPDNHYTWLVPEYADEFALFIPMGSKESKIATGSITSTLFKTYSIGLNTARDCWVYNF